MTADWKQAAADAWNNPGWKERAAFLRRLMSDNVSLERAWHEICRAARERYNAAPEATYNAVVYELRTHGFAQLKEANCQRRIGDLSAAQVKAVIASLQQRRGQYPNVSDELLTALATIYDAKGE